MINCFKKLMPDMSEKEVNWKWTEERETAFTNIKKEFAINLKIYDPQYDKPLILRTDASINKFAGVLMQFQNGKEVPICFVSRVTKEYEKKYSISELEFAA